MYTSVESRNREHRKLTTSQLCIRAGGKHNDLDNVGLSIIVYSQIGFTPRHQTMFEMLGNFSLGAYYKEEAILLANEFLTHEIGMNRENLRISVHKQDPTARELWKKASSRFRCHCRSVASATTRSLRATTLIISGAWAPATLPAATVPKSSSLYAYFPILSRPTRTRPTTTGWRFGISCS